MYSINCYEKNRNGGYTIKNLLRIFRGDKKLSINEIN